MHGDIFVGLGFTDVGSNSSDGSKILLHDINNPSKIYPGLVVHFSVLRPQIKSGFLFRNSFTKQGSVSESEAQTRKPRNLFIGDSDPPLSPEYANKSPLALSTKPAASLHAASLGEKKATSFAVLFARAQLSVVKGLLAPCRDTHAPLFVCIFSLTGRWINKPARYSGLRPRDPSLKQFSSAVSLHDTAGSVVISFGKI